jgi:LPS-assembly protein
VQLGDNWRARADWRYDFTSGRAARAGLGLDYETECIRVDLSLSRRFASSTNVSPSTDFGFRVSLLGLGGQSGSAAKARKCRG